LSSEIEKTKILLFIQIAENFISAVLYTTSSAWWLFLQRY
jgi:hypothetical protein